MIDYRNEWPKNESEIKSYDIGSKCHVIRDLNRMVRLLKVEKAGVKWMMRRKGVTEWREVKGKKNQDKALDKEEKPIYILLIVFLNSVKPGL